MLKSASSPLTLSSRLQHLLVAALVILSATQQRFGVEAKDDDNSVCSQGGDIDPSPDWVNYGGFLFLIVLVIIMFWALALVCEEYFVPALNIMCVKAKIPDDVAGATFMAAGASSPELFTAFIGLLIYDSNIGVGTVVGSEIFNHMIISAGSVLFAVGGVLYLDARILLRDLIAYMVSLLALIWSLKGPHRALLHAFDPSIWDQCLDVSLAHGMLLVGIYILYAIVCGNFQRLTRYLCPRAPVDDDAQARADAAAAAAAGDSIEAPRRDSLTYGTRQDTSGESKANETVNPMVPDAGSRIVSVDLHNETTNRPTLSETPSLSSRPSILLAPYEPRASFRNGPLYQWETDESRIIPEGGERMSLLGFGGGERQSHVSRMSTSSRVGGAPGATIRISRAAREDFTRDSFIEVTPPPGEAGDIELSDSTNNDGESNIKSPLRKRIDDLISEQQSLTPTLTAVPNAPSPAMYRCLQILGTANPPDFGVMRAGASTLKCYLSLYSDVIKLDALPELMMWHLRYFTIDDLGFYSIGFIDDEIVGSHVEIIDLTFARQATVVDKSELKFQIDHDKQGDVETPSLLFRAPSEEIMTEVVKRINEKIETMRAMDILSKEAKLADARAVLWQPLDEDKHHSLEEELLAAPRGRYLFIWHLMTYPLKLMFTWTLVDVRTEKYKDYYGLVILICGFYLAALSYVMIECCNFLGDYIGASPTVMGLTLSAVGTSFPNLWSSMVVARQGYGSMAISNALGSNVFNINMALALPWVFKVLIDGKDYREMRDEGIVLLIVLLEIVCVIWFALIFMAGFRMYAWMSWVWVVMYIVVLATSIALA